MTKTYPTLYSRDSKGKVRLWKMELNGDKYRTVAGLQDGKHVISEYSVATPKNEGKTNSTTGEEQAILEIEAAYKKQLKTGYFEDISDIDKDQYFQVMLAKSYLDYKDKINWSKGVGVQIKYNGGRIVARKTGLFTRKGEKILCIPHIEEGLKSFFDTYPNAILDGEGFNYELRDKLNEIMSLLRKTVHISSEDLEKSKSLIRYYVYDGGNIGSVSLSENYLVRKQCIDQVFKNIYGGKLLHG